LTDPRANLSSKKTQPNCKVQAFTDYMQDTSYET